MLAWSRPGPPCEVGRPHAALPDTHTHPLHVGMHNDAVVGALCGKPRDCMLGVLRHLWAHYAWLAIMWPCDACIQLLGLLDFDLSTDVWVKHFESVRGRLRCVRYASAGREVVALGRELLGGNGIVSDFLCAKTFCDMEAYYTYEGTYEVNALVVGREATKIAAFKAPPKRAQHSKPDVQA